MALSIAAVSAMQAQTQRINFKSTLPTKNVITKDGSCWTHSIASNRVGAWRCSVGNSIYDPCFKIANSAKLVCPFIDNNNQSLVINLNKPLPKVIMSMIQIPQPFRMQLENGSICMPFTGTLPFAQGHVLRYGCDNGGWGVNDVSWHGRDATANLMKFGHDKSGQPIVIANKREPIAKLRY